MIPIRDYTLDDDLIERTVADGLPRVRVYRPAAPAVVLGRGSRLEAEVDIGALIEDGVPLLKRRGGGCAVFLDPGNIIVSTVLKVPGFGDNDRHFKRLSAWIIEALGEIGVSGVYCDGISDLVHEDRKVGGACIHRTKDRLHYSTTLLIEPRIGKAARYLKHPPREPAYRRGRDHAAFMGALSPRPWPGSMAGLAKRLSQALDPRAALSKVLA